MTRVVASSDDCIQVIPKRLLLFLVFIPDLLVIAKYALLSAIICARDRLYIFGCWLTYMNQLCPKSFPVALDSLII